MKTAVHNGYVVELMDPRAFRCAKSGTEYHPARWRTVEPDRTRAEWCDKHLPKWAREIVGDR